MFDNYIGKNSKSLDEVTSTNTAIRFVLNMLQEFDIQLYYDPNKPTTHEKTKGEDDMFSYCKDMVERLLLSLVFDVCEEEADAEGLRALRRVMVSYFLAKGRVQKVGQYVYDFEQFFLCVLLLSSSHLNYSPTPRRVAIGF